MSHHRGGEATNQGFFRVPVLAGIASAAQAPPGSSAVAGSSLLVQRYGWRAAGREVGDSMRPCVDVFVRGDILFSEEAIGTCSVLLTERLVTALGDPS
jgi:hypothetical protein